jgi:hypothetical protein
MAGFEPFSVQIPADPPISWAYWATARLAIYRVDYVAKSEKTFMD